MLLHQGIEMKHWGMLMCRTNLAKLLFHLRKVSGCCCVFWPAYNRHSTAAVLILVECVLLREQIFNKYSVCDAKTMHKIGSFFGSKTADQRFGEMQKKPVFCCKIFAFLRFFAQKTLKMSILTSIWSAQHPNAGRNIQHSCVSCFEV